MCARDSKVRALVAIAWLGSSFSPLFPGALRADEGRFGEWKVEPTPALAPSAPEAWDDFGVFSATVVRLGDKWSAFYEGATLTEDGESHGFGRAESTDGVIWSKHSANPVFVPGTHEWEDATAPSLTKWHDGWIAVFVLIRALTYEQKSLDEFDLPRESVWLAQSDDGLRWEALGELKTLPFKRTRAADSRPCIYSDGTSLHLWWIGDSEQGPALFHSVSRDAQQWSRPNLQLTKDFDNREVCCARVQPSGDFYILTYVALNDRTAADSGVVVTKVSQNARTWTANGPPEFPLPPYFSWSLQWQQAAPQIVFTKEGARLFYIDLLFPKQSTRPHPRRDPVRGAVLRTAFSPKGNVAK